MSKASPELLLACNFQEVNTRDGQLTPLFASVCRNRTQVTLVSQEGGEWLQKCAAVATVTVDGNSMKHGCHTETGPGSVVVRESYKWLPLFLEFSHHSIANKMMNIER